MSVVPVGALLFNSKSVVCNTKRTLYTFNHLNPMKNYIQKIRTKLGHESFIHPAARILIENINHEFLVIERQDNGNLGIPTGALEEGETIQECIIREVNEETGLQLLDVEVIGISSSPNLESVSYPNGDQIQYFTIEFYSNSWTGEIKINDPDEVKNTRFAPLSLLDNLPPNERSILKSLQYYRDTRKVLLK